MTAETALREAAPTLANALALPFLRATRRAALACIPHLGGGDGKAADGAAVAALRTALAEAPGDGVVVIGEGEKDEAPMLHNGEAVGAGGSPLYDVAVDPLEGTKFAAAGLPGAVSVISACERGRMWSPGPGFYMDKLVVGPSARGSADLSLSAEENVERVARALGKEVPQMRVFVLDKPRHEALIRGLRARGVSVTCPPDGDVAGALQALVPDGEADMLLGVGGTPEGVLAACAAACLGGELQGRLEPQSGEEREALAEAGLDTDRVIGLEDLVGGECVFAATGVSGGLLRGPGRGLSGTRTDSLLLTRGGLSRVSQETPGDRATNGGEHGAG